MQDIFSLQLDAALNWMKFSLEWNVRAAVELVLHIKRMSKTTLCFLQVKA